MAAVKHSHRVISTTTVVAADAPPPGTRRIELTPCDLQFLFFNQIQKGLLFRKPDHHNHRYTVGHLKHSLSRALAIFYPLAGRLASADDSDGTTSFFLDCNNAGAMFVHAISGSVTVDDVTGPAVVPDEIIYPFFAMNGTLNCDGVSQPLLAVQVTELADGIFVACSVNHSVFDGASFWQFFNAWARLNRDDVIDECPPIIGHNYLEGVVDLPIRLPSTVIPDDHDMVTSCRHAPAAALQQRMFRFSREKIAQLKAEANVEMGTDKISSLQALMAHLWVSVTRHRKVASEEEVTYSLMVGLRSRLDPPLPDQHIGNVVVRARVKLSARELLGACGAGYAAWEMNRMIASKSFGGVMSFFRDWVLSPVFFSEAKRPRNYLMTGSSPRFDVYGNNFGWGKPVAVRSGPGNKFDGKLTVFAGAEEGSIEFEACLLRETHEALANDEEFMQSLETR